MGTRSILRSKLVEATYTQNINVANGNRVQNHDAGLAVDTRDTIYGTGTARLTEDFETRNSFDQAGEGGVYGRELAFMSIPVAQILANWRLTSASFQCYFQLPVDAGAGALTPVRVARMYPTMDYTLISYNDRVAVGGTPWAKGAPDNFSNSTPWGFQTASHISAAQVECDDGNNITSDEETAGTWGTGLAPNLGYRNWNILTWIRRFRLPVGDPLRFENNGLIFYQRTVRLAGGAARMQWGGRNNANPPRVQYVYTYG